MQKTTTGEAPGTQSHAGFGSGARSSGTQNPQRAWVTKKTSCVGKGGGAGQRGPVINQEPEVAARAARRQHHGRARAARSLGTPRARPPNTRRRNTERPRRSAPPPHRASPAQPARPPARGVHEANQCARPGQRRERRKATERERETERRRESPLEPVTKRNHQPA